VIDFQELDLKAEPVGLIGVVGQTKPYNKASGTREGHGLAGNGALPRGLGRAALAGALAAVLAGCTMVGPNFVAPKVDVANAWATKDATRISATRPEDAAWWRTFRDPTLDRLIELAYGQNLSLQQSGVNVLRARAQLGAAIGSEYPQQQQLVGQYQYNSRGGGDPTPLPFGVTDRSYSTLGYGFTTAWELDFWGKFRRAVESADANFLASISNYDAALVSLTATVGTTYVAMRTAAARLAVVRANVKVQEQSLKIARARFENGETGERDVAQASSQLAETRAQIPPLEVSLYQNRNALAALLSITPNELARVLPERGPIPRAPPKVAAGIPHDLLRQRPDVRQAEQVAAAESALIGATEADLYPAFSLSGTFGFSASDIGNRRLGDAFNWSGHAASVGPAVQWNLFNYGQITNQVRAQDAQFQAAVLAYQNAVLQAQREVEDALIAFVKADDTVRHLQDAVAAAKRSVQLAVAQYKEGATDFTTVLTAEQSLLRQQDQLTVARGNVPQSLIAVYQALGGGWQMREGHDFVPDALKDEMRARTDWGGLLAPKAHLPPSQAERKAVMRRPDW
jgi:NodT family efflux transporter outer membrane factor (OMF) lipoprotein